MERKLVSIWQGSLIDLHRFVARHKLVDHVLQILPDDPGTRGYWLVLKYTEEAAVQLQQKASKRLTMI